MTRSITHLLFACASLLFLFTDLRAQQMQDVVYLKNGSVIRGMIIEQVPGQSLKIQTKDGSVFAYAMSDVEKMTKEPEVGESAGPSASRFGIGGHVGTDISGGLGFGGGVSYLIAPPGTAYEFAVDYFFHQYEETDGGNTENVDLSIFAVRANGLWNYEDGQSCVYFITGVGFVVAILDWRNEYDPAVYGYSLTESEEFTSVGNVFNLGIGYANPSGFGVRLETPMIFFYDAGQSTSFVPTFALALKYYF